MLTVLFCHVSTVVPTGNMDLQSKQFRKNLSKENEKNVFLSPWGGLVCRNCDDLGDLLTFKNIREFKDSDKPLWLLLSLVLFRENVG